MKILRVQLRNWRGVKECEVTLAAPGVTVVTGRNEVGKSSLFEGLRMLFEELDSARSRKVQAVQPVHTDVGAEVEAEVELGPHRFVYRKRFHKKPQTELRILTPRAENLTGRDAHARVEALLDEHLDAALWKALQVSQSGDLGQPALQDSTWLRSALDRAAGGTSINDPEAHSLFELAVAESGRWYTDAGKEKRELSGPRDELCERQAEVQRLRERLSAIDQDLQQEQRLAGDERRAQQAAAEAQTMAVRHADELARVRKLGIEHERLKSALVTAAAALDRAQSACKERARVEAELAKAGEDLQKATSALQDGTESREAALAGERQARQALLEAEGVAVTARASATLAAADAEFRHAELDLAQLQERRARIEACDRADADAAEELQNAKVDDAELVRLEQLDNQRTLADAALAAAGARVELAAAADCSMRINGEVVELAAGVRREQISAEPLLVELPGLLSIRVRSGSGIDRPRQNAEDAQRELREALAGVGVDSLPTARLAHGKRVDAMKARKRYAEDRKRELRDLTLEQLLGKVGRLAREVDGYGVRRASEPRLPADLDEAKANKLQTEQALAEAEAAVKAASEAHKLRSNTANDNAKAFEGADAQRQLLLQRVEEKRQELKEAEQRVSAAALREALDSALHEHGEAARQERTAADQLATLQPDIAEELAAESAERAESLRNVQRTLRERLLILRARLEAGGDDGLSAQLGLAESACEQARVHAESIAMQARAAITLLGALQRARTEEELRYVQPYQQRVETLARIVFGADCRVHVDNDLTIVNRTLDGRTVPFDSLSGGAKEQFAVVLRLACALLASEQGGVPVVLDDAFGWSDPERLERMGLLLAQAGRSCQVVLLTCEPARARVIPGARIVDL